MSLILTFGSLKVKSIQEITIFFIVIFMKLVEYKCIYFKKHISYTSIPTTITYYSSISFEWERWSWFFVKHDRNLASYRTASSDQVFLSRPSLILWQRKVGKMHLLLGMSSHFSHSYYLKPHNTAKWKPLISPYHKPVLSVTSKRGRSSISGKNPSSRFGRIILFWKTKNLNCCCACH